MKTKEEWSANFRLKTGETGTCIFREIVEESRDDSHVVARQLVEAVLDDPNDENGGFLNQQKHDELVKLVEMGAVTEKERVK